MACLPKNPGPAVVAYQDLLIDETPALLSVKLFQAGINLWYAEVSNRRTRQFLYRTDFWLLKQGAYAQAKIFMAPYLYGLVALP